MAEVLDEKSIPEEKWARFPDFEREILGQLQVPTQLKEFFMKRLISLIESALTKTSRRKINLDFTNDAFNLRIAQSESKRMLIVTIMKKASIFQRNHLFF